MKKNYLIIVAVLSIILTSAILITSCSKSKKGHAPLMNTEMIISQNNSPQITSDIYTKFGFANFVPDTLRDVILDTTNSELTVPYDQSKTILKKSTASAEVFGICIRIATRRSACASGIGFRCGFVRNCFEPQKQNFKDAQQLSRARIQPVDIAVDKDSGKLILHFINKIDWKYLSNN